ncbi:MAG: hypothetical protein ACFB0B_04495 [Thermonemataceae bacterium]
MDAALTLKKQVDSGAIRHYEEAQPYLEKSSLVQQLLSPLDTSVPYLLNRLIQLAEIPFSREMPIVKEWVHLLFEKSFTGAGFSFTGKSNDLLACYNAMITRVLLLLQHPNTEGIYKGIDWILQYQVVERGQVCTWEGKGILKYGGCMKATPCYIGLVKSMQALSTYIREYPQADEKIKQKLDKGLQYILEQRVYLRRSNEAPITKDILKLTYPFTYKINVIEVLLLLKENRLLKDQRCEETKQYLLSKKNKQGRWRIHKVAYPKYWIPFDSSENEYSWLNYLLIKLLD